MKTFIRIGAGLSSTFFFVSGAVILAQTRFGDRNEHVFPIALGLFLLGIGCFTGPFLWLLAEKWFSKT